MAGDARRSFATTATTRRRRTKDRRHATKKGGPVAALFRLPGDIRTAPGAPLFLREEDDQKDDQNDQKNGPNPDVHSAPFLWRIKYPGRGAENLLVLVNSG